MRVINWTYWNTKDMRAILTRIAAEEIMDVSKRKRIRVNIKYGHHRTNMCSGRATIYGHYMTIFVQAHGVDVIDFAFVAAHEMAHLEGLRHTAMGAKYRDRTTSVVLARYPWLSGCSITKKELAPKPKQNLKLVRFERAKRNLQRAQTRLKRAKTIFAKWQSKVRRYEREQERTAAVLPSQQRSV